MGGGAVLANNSGLSPQVTTKANLSPRVPHHHHGSQNLTDLATNIEKPLYTRGHSKIGSGVIRPFQPNAANAQISNTLVQQQHA